MAKQVQVALEEFRNASKSELNIAIIIHIAMYLYDQRSVQIEVQIPVTVYVNTIAVGVSRAIQPLYLVATYLPFCPSVVREGTYYRQFNNMPMLMAEPLYN